MASPASTPHSTGLYRASLFGLGAWLAGRFSLAQVRSLAATIGKLYAKMHPRRVEVIQRNLQLIDSAATKESAAKVYEEFGKTLADYFYIGTRPVAEAAQIIARVDGEEHLHAAHQLGRGALVVTGHLGLFELGGLLLAKHGFSSVVLTHPEPSKSLTTWRANFRKRWNVDTLEVGMDRFAFLQIAERLRQGSFVATLIDRPGTTDNTPVTFPHGTSHFSAGILLLASYGGVPVIPATMVRRDDGAYHAQVFAPIFIEPQGPRDVTLQHYSQQIANALMPVLRAYPRQWYQFVPLTPAV